MKQYLENLWAFIGGFWRLDTLGYKKGWGPVLFFPLYLVDYGTRVLCGGAVVSWSRWFHANRKQYHWAAFMNRILNHIEDDHGESSGPELWGTKDCSPALQLLLSVGWIVLIVVWLQ